MVVLVAILRLEGFSIQHCPKGAPPVIQETDRRDLGEIRLALVQRAKGADELICTVQYSTLRRKKGEIRARWCYM